MISSNVTYKHNDSGTETAMTKLLVIKKYASDMKHIFPLIQPRLSKKRFSQCFLHTSI